MAARMPACYASVYKVLEEVSMRLPAFAPESMLDFGSGPGTAIWAAHEVRSLEAYIFSMLLGSLSCRAAVCYMPVTWLRPPALHLV